MKNKINVLNRKADKPYLIAEIGINHNGDLNIARKLMDAVNACGWDCAKFQKREPDVCVPENQKNIPRETPWGKMTYIEYKHKIEFGEKEYNEIKGYCEAKPIDWSLSVWDLQSLDFVSKYNLPFIKIPSAHLTNLELIKAVAESKTDCILSTGMSDWKMIDNAVEILERYNANYALMHCNSSYPAPHHEINLALIPEMANRYNCTIGYSGHEFDLEPTVLAVSMGAKIIERHVTLDHNMWGTDHKSSLEVHAMDLLAKRITGIKAIIGDNKKIITESEKEIMIKLRGTQ
ncbi:N-acetylneuraminate synthase family protein [bacterium]|nr:N-acetylneuraminate synthase family protein [bacterium]